MNVVSARVRGVWMCEGFITVRQGGVEQVGGTGLASRLETATQVLGVGTTSNFLLVCQRDQNGSHFSGLLWCHAELEPAAAGALKQRDQTSVRCFYDCDFNCFGFCKVADAMCFHGLS